MCKIEIIIYLQLQLSNFFFNFRINTVDADQLATVAAVQPYQSTSGVPARFNNASIDRYFRSLEKLGSDPRERPVFSDLDPIREPKHGETIDCLSIRGTPFGREGIRQSSSNLLIFEENNNEKEFQKQLNEMMDDLLMSIDNNDDDLFSRVTAAIEKLETVRSEGLGSPLQPGAERSLSTFKNVGWLAPEEKEHFSSSNGRRNDTGEERLANDRLDKHQSKSSAVRPVSSHDEPSNSVTIKFREHEQQNASERATTCAECARLRGNGPSYACAHCTNNVPQVAPLIPILSLHNSESAVFSRESISKGKTKAFYFPMNSSEDAVRDSENFSYEKLSENKPSVFDFLKSELSVKLEESTDNGDFLKTTAASLSVEVCDTNNGGRDRIHSSYPKHRKSDELNSSRKKKSLSGITVGDSMTFKYEDVETPKDSLSDELKAELYLNLRDSADFAAVHRPLAKTTTKKKQERGEKLLAKTSLDTVVSDDVDAVDVHIPVATLSNEQNLKSHKSASKSSTKMSHVAFDAYRDVVGMSIKEGRDDKEVAESDAHRSQNNVTSADDSYYKDLLHHLVTDPRLKSTDDAEIANKRRQHGVFNTNHNFGDAPIPRKSTNRPQSAVVASGCKSATFASVSASSNKKVAWNRNELERSTKSVPVVEIGVPRRPTSAKVGGHFDSALQDIPRQSSDSLSRDPPSVEAKSVTRGRLVAF